MGDDNTDVDMAKKIPAYPSQKSGQKTTINQATGRR
jgi:hypothetical protein